MREGSPLVLPDMTHTQLCHMTQLTSCILPPQSVLASRKELVKYDQKKMEMGPLISLSEPTTPAATPTMPLQLKVCK